MRSISIILHAAVFTILLLAPAAFSQNAIPVPSEASQVRSWFGDNVKALAARKSSLDLALVAAESTTRIIKVRKDGSGQFNTINKAIESIPSGNKQRTVVWIGPGVYNEKIKIDRTKPFVTLYGAPNAMPNLTYSGTAKQYGTVNSATLIVESDYFTAANIIIANSAPRPDGKREGAQAVALRISGDKAAFYNCKIIGFQDTVCDDRGNHFFKDCYIEGTVDFIFGSGKSLYLNTELHVIGDSGFRVIAAQARESESQDTGYSFVHCKVTGTGTGTFLGRAWQTRPRVVYAYTSMSSVVNPAGWSDNFHSERDGTVFYGEYKCTGTGSNFSGRVKYAKKLTDAQAKPFISLDFIGGSKWLLPPPNL